MITKTKIISNKEIFGVIQSAVNRMVDFIKDTFGPASNKVIIDRPTHCMIVDDGVQIGRDFQLPLPEENAIVKIIREVSGKTNDRVGDGTTGALIILQAIINEVARKRKIDGRKIEIELKKGLEEAKKQLLSSVAKIKTKEELKKTALISYDNEEIAEIVANLYFKHGKDVVITVEKSPAMKTESVESEGLKIDRGYISPYMVTNPQRMEAEIEKPYILITDLRLTEFGDILPIMERLVKENKRDLVIIAENIEGSALATIVINKIKGEFNVVAINAPSSGKDRTVFLNDIALMTGAKMFSSEKGDKLPKTIEEVNLDDLGKAAKFICKQNESIIMGPKGQKADIAYNISALKQSIENEKNENSKEQMKLRLARFTNKIAVIKVGAMTENERTALKYKTEDAVNSVRAAYKNGVVAGAGLSLARIKTSSELLNEALKYPYRQLCENMGMDVAPLGKDGEALNVVTGKRGNYMEVGVMDPVDILIAGVESAISIASLLLTSSGMIVEYPKEHGEE